VVIVGRQQVDVAEKLWHFHRTDFNGISTVCGYDQARATTALTISFFHLKHLKLRRRLLTVFAKIAKIFNQVHLQLKSHFRPLLSQFNIRCSYFMHRRHRHICCRYMDCPMVWAGAVSCLTLVTTALLPEMRYMWVRINHAPATPANV